MGSTTSHVADDAFDTWYYTRRNRDNLRGGTDGGDNSMPGNTDEGTDLGTI